MAKVRSKATKVKCERCGSLIHPAWMAKHQAGARCVPGEASVSVKSEPSVQRILKEQRHVRSALVVVVTTVFPKGITTEDPDHLDRILDWLDETEALLTMQRVNRG